jgi:hypothetical protein
MRDLVNEARDASLGRDLDRDAELDEAFEVTRKPWLAKRLRRRLRHD